MCIGFNQQENISLVKAKRKRVKSSYLRSNIGMSSKYGRAISARKNLIKDQNSFHKMRSTSTKQIGMTTTSNSIFETYDCTNDNHRPDHQSIKYQKYAILSHSNATKL